MKPEASRGLRKGAIRVGGALACAYGFLVLVVGCSQRRLIYHPTRMDPETALQIAAEDGLAPWTNSIGSRIGWRRTSGTGAGSVLVLHGNAGSAARRGYLVGPIHAATGMDVHVLEYPGFGSREGRPSQDSLTDAAAEGLGLLASRGPVFLVGESLGTGVASYLAGRHSKDVRGVILLTPFDSLESAARHHYPFLPVGMILADTYPSAAWIQGYKGPLGVVIAAQDQVVPAELGRRLHDSYTGPRRLWVVPGADHWEGANRPVAWWKEAFGFLQAPVP